MKKALRLCAGLVFLSSVGLLFASFSGFGRGAVNEAAPLRFEPKPFRIPQVMQVGQEYDMDVAVVNESSETAQLIGSLQVCSSACFSGRGLPTAIPARGRGRVTVHAHVGGRPSSFSSELTFYTDRPTQPTITLKLEGTIVDDGPDVSKKAQAANP